MVYNDGERAKDGGDLAHQRAEVKLRNAIDNAKKPAKKAGSEDFVGSAKCKGPLRSVEYACGAIADLVD